MKKNFFISAALHVTVFLALVIGLPHLKPPMEIAQPIPIDITDVGPITTTKQVGEGNKATPKDIAPPPKPTPQEQKELPKPDDVKPEPPKPAPKPEPVPEKTKEPVEEDKTNATIPEKKKKVEKPKDEKPPEKTTDKPKEKTPDKKSEKQDDTKQDFNQLLKNLTPAKDVTPPAPDSSASPDAKKDASTGSKGVVSEKLTISQEDALRRQIEQCWNIPVGGRDVENMIVDVKIDVNADRTVSNVTVIDQARMNSDPFFRSLAESAVRAVRNPRCSPLELPPDQYDMWKSITFRFNPKEMLGM